MGSTVESRRRVRAAGKPYDEPVRKGKIQSPTDLVIARAPVIGPIWWNFAIVAFSDARDQLISQNLCLLPRLPFEMPEIFITHC